MTRSCRPLAPWLFALVAALGILPRPAAAVQLFRYDFDSGTTNASSVVSGLTATPISATNLSTSIVANVYRTTGYGSTFDAGQYFEFTTTANSGKAINLSDLRFTPETPSQATAVTAFVRSSADGFTGNIYTRNIPSNSFFFNETIDLTGPTYQNLASITFRFYGTSPSTSTVLNYDTVNLNGNVVNAVPEPATWALVLGGLTCGGMLLRRRHAR